MINSNISSKKLFDIVFKYFIKLITKNISLLINF